MKRKSRDIIDKEDIDILKPIDLSMFGGPDDPCFGKYHDLKADECRACGDSEICAIACSQANHVKRAKLEAEQPFKDMEDEEPAESPEVKYMRSKVAKGLSEDRVIRKAVKKFEISKNKAKEIFKTL